MASLLHGRFSSYSQQHAIGSSHHEQSVSQELLQQFVQTSQVHAEQQHTASVVTLLSSRKANEALEPSASITTAKSDNIFLRISFISNF